MNIFTQLLQQDFIYVLISIAFSAIVSELRKTYRGKFNIFKTVGEWLFTTIVNFGLYLFFMPFAKKHDDGQIMLFAATLILSCFGTKGIEKFFKHLKKSFKNDKNREGVSLVLKGLLKILGDDDDDEDSS